MKSLVVLKIGKNDIEDISPLKNLKNLKVLELFENMIEDVSPLNNLKNLEYLSIFGNFLGEKLKHTKMTKSQKKGQQKKNLETLNKLSNLKFLGQVVTGLPQ